MFLKGEIYLLQWDGSSWHMLTATQVEWSRNECITSKIYFMKQQGCCDHFISCLIKTLFVYVQLFYVKNKFYEN